MKETGVIRRLDELGRIVIPKEIRDRLKIDHSDMMDICIEEDQIILKKFHPMSNDLIGISSLCQSLKEIYGCDLIVTDRHQVLIYTMKTDLSFKELDKTFLTRMNSFSEQEVSSLNKMNLTPDFQINKDAVVYPIRIRGEFYGYLLIMDEMIGKKQKEIGDLVLNFLNRCL